MTALFVPAPALSRGALATVALATMSITACSTQPPQPQVATTPRATSPRAAASKSLNPQLSIPLASGIYRCDENAPVDVTADTRDATRIDVGWQGQRYTLTRHDSYSGLPRYEDVSVYPHHLY